MNETSQKSSSDIELTQYSLPKTSEEEEPKKTPTWIKIAVAIFIIVIVIIIIAVVVIPSRQEENACSKDNLQGKCPPEQVCKTISGSTQCFPICDASNDNCPAGQSCQSINSEYKCADIPCGTELGVCATGKCTPSENNIGYSCLADCSPDAYGYCVSGQGCQKDPTTGQYSCKKVSCTGPTYATDCPSNQTCTRSNDGMYSCELICANGGTACAKASYNCVAGTCVPSKCGGTINDKCGSGYDCALDPIDGTFECEKTCGGLDTGVCGTGVCYQDLTSGLYSCVPPTCSPSNTGGTCPPAEVCDKGTCITPECKGATKGVCPQGLSDKPPSAAYCDPLNQVCRQGSNGYYCDYYNCQDNTCGPASEGNYCKYKEGSFQEIASDPSQNFAFLDSGIVFGKEAQFVCAKNESQTFYPPGTYQVNQYACVQKLPNVAPEQCTYLCAHNSVCDFAEGYVPVGPDSSNGPNLFQCNLYKNYNYQDPYFDKPANGQVDISQYSALNTRLCQLPATYFSSNFTVQPTYKKNPTQTTKDDCGSSTNPYTIWTSQSDTAGMCTEFTGVEYPNYLTQTGFKTSNEVLRKRYKAVGTPRKSDTGILDIAAGSEADCADMSSIYGKLFSNSGKGFSNPQTCGTSYPCMIFNPPTSGDVYDVGFFYDSPTNTVVTVEGPFIQYPFLYAVPDVGIIGTRDECFQFANTAEQRNNLLMYDKNSGRCASYKDSVQPYTIGIAE